MPTFLIYKVVTANLPAVSREVQHRQPTKRRVPCRSINASTSKALSAELKAAIAKEFTRIHVEFTAAPEPFVNVVF